MLPLRGYVHPALECLNVVESHTQIVFRCDEYHGVGQLEHLPTNKDIEPYVSVARVGIENLFYVRGIHNFIH